ncbi:class I SAM-dependent methyltransferase [Halalkalicoccus jeotgali]
MDHRRRDRPDPDTVFQALEVGIKPGVSIQHAATRVLDGFVAGVDTSEVMLAQARDRNRQAIEAGRVALAHESATSLPHEDRTGPLLPIPTSHRDLRSTCSSYVSLPRRYFRKRITH